MGDAPSGSSLPSTAANPASLATAFPAHPKKHSRSDVAKAQVAQSPSLLRRSVRRRISKGLPEVLAARTVGLEECLAAAPDGDVPAGVEVVRVVVGDRDEG